MVFKCNYFLLVLTVCLLNDSGKHCFCSIDFVHYFLYVIFYLYYRCMPRLFFRRIPYSSMYSSLLKSSSDDPPPPPPEGATFGVFIASTTACPIPDTIPVPTDVNMEAVSDMTDETMSEDRKSVV